MIEGKRGKGREGKGDGKGGGRELRGKGRRKGRERQGKGGEGRGREGK